MLAVVEAGVVQTAQGKKVEVQAAARTVMSSAKEVAAGLLAASTVAMDAEGRAVVRLAMAAALMAEVEVMVAVVAAAEG
eukprot:6181888-Pleurochrysis_carterae.AAC.2